MRDVDKKRWRKRQKTKDKDKNRDERRWRLWDNRIDVTIEKKEITLNGIGYKLGIFDPHENEIDDGHKKTKLMMMMMNTKFT